MFFGDLDATTTAHAHCKKAELARCCALNRIIHTRDLLCSAGNSTAGLADRSLVLLEMDLFGDLPPPSEDEGKKHMTEEGKF